MRRRQTRPHRYRGDAVFSPRAAPAAVSISRPQSLTAFAEILQREEHLRGRRRRRRRREEEEEEVAAVAVVGSFGRTSRRREPPGCRR